MGIAKDGDDYLSAVQSEDLLETWFNVGRITWPTASCLCPMVNSVADASTLAPSQMSSSATARPSLLSRLLHLLVPCVSLQSTSHIVELDSQPISKSPLQEKLDSKPTLHTDEVVQQDTPSLTLPPPLPADLALVTPSSSRPATPLLSEHVDEVIPTPTHLLPQDETAGMTSGAVQPPGSKGDSPTVEKSPPSSSLTNGDGDDSEGTSYTEEDIDEQDDDEDRLIFNGGAGIPTGPVSSSPSLASPSSFYPIHRTAFPNPFFPPYPRITQVGSVLYLISMKLWSTVVSRSVFSLVGSPLSQPLFLVYIPGRLCCSSRNRVSLA
jgi:hypothetical protein